ncbi:MAG: hypothetical protein ACR2FQ_11985 [Pseudonocardiaceae bacterium]
MRGDAALVLVAHHEAGHATWYATRGLPPAAVRIHPGWFGRGPAGRCVVDGGWVDDPRDAAGGALTGPEAEAAYRRRAGQPWPAALADAYAASGDDIADARGYLAELGDPTAAWAPVRAAARAHVLAHRAAIEAVAAALLRRRRLTGGQVRELVRRHRDAPYGVVRRRPTL